MKELFSFIIDQITDPLSLPINPLYEWVILGVIGLIAYVVAYNKVGDMYHSGMIHGSLLGSLSHWIIRLLTFIPLWFVTYWAIVIGQWIIANWIVVVSVLAGVTACVLACVIYRHINNKKTRNGVTGA